MVDSTKTLTIFKIFSKLEFSTPTNVLDFLNANSISINQSCGGNGACTTCRIFVRKGLEAFSERTELELERAEERDFLINERLACQCIISDSAEIEIPI